LIIDQSGSYQSTGAAIEQAARLIEHSACPGDEWFVRAIGTDSYAPSAHLFTATLDRVGTPPPTPANPVAVGQYARAQHAWHLKHQTFQAQRSTVAGEVRKIPVGIEQASDIWGALLKADELLAQTPAGYQPVIILATDLDDNRGRQDALHLAGVFVLVLAFEGDDPVVSRALRAQWQTVFEQAGAARFVIRDAAELAPDALDTLLTPPAQSSAGKRKGDDHV